jgi:hypothetical protein
LEEKPYPGDRALERKIKILEEGEIAIYRRLGLLPVFFGINVTTIIFGKEEKPPKAPISLTGTRAGR